MALGGVVVGGGAPLGVELTRIAPEAAPTVTELTCLPEESRV